MIRLHSTFAALTAFGLVTSSGTPEEPRVFPGSARKIAQLTGDRDQPRGVATRSLTATRAHLTATDLGSSFEHAGKLYFLFGDSAGGPPNADALAWTSARVPEDVELTFHTDPNGAFVPLSVPGITSGAFEVPSYGISLDGVMYVVFTTDHTENNTMGRSVLATSKDDGRTFERVHDLSTTRFVNVALARARAADHPSAPGEDVVLVWGSGRYRASSPRLAYVPTKRITDKTAVRYFGGMTGAEPRWVDTEADSADLFDHPVVGELSVAWISALKRWVMLYNSSSPRGIVLRTSPTPWGPWTAPQVAFDPWLDGGYANFLHVSWKTAKMDTFQDEGKADTWGGEYGPYLIPRFTKGDERRCTLTFTMSTWNPYQVVLMSVDVGQPDPDAKYKEESLLPGSPPFATFGANPVSFRRNGKPHVRTYAANGDADLFASHVALRPGGGSSLSFQIHGGHGRVVLVNETQMPPSPIEDIAAFQSALLAGEYGPVLESVAGPSSNDVDVSVRWSLDYAPTTRLRLHVLDASKARWGFLSVSEMSWRTRTSGR